MDLLLQSIIVAVAIWLIFFDKYVTQFFTYRPIVVGTIVGALMGNIVIGLEVGTIIELMFLGQIFVGTALPPEETFSTGIAAAFGVLTGNAAIAIATALPLAVLGQMAMYFRNMVLSEITGKRVEASARALNTRGIFFWGQVMPNIFNLLLFALPTFLAIYFGAGVVQQVIDAIPTVIVDGLVVGGFMIGAVGLALLLQSIRAKGIWPYFLVGFFLASYLKIGMIGITVAAIICVAIAYYNERRQDELVAQGA